MSQVQGLLAPSLRNPSRRAVRADGVPLLREPASGFDPSAPIPIRLPRAVPIRQARRPSASASAWLREEYRKAPRRRLRREVRMAGAALLLIAPLTAAAFLLSSVRGHARGSESQVERLDRPSTAARPPVISLMIESPAQGFHAEPQAPVVLHGYVLPDDGAEEPSHAGG